MRIIVRRTCAVDAPRLTDRGTTAIFRRNGIICGVLGALLGYLLLCSSPVWAQASLNLTCKDVPLGKIIRAGWSLSNDPPEMVYYAGGYVGPVDRDTPVSPPPGTIPSNYFPYTSIRDCPYENTWYYVGIYRSPGPTVTPGNNSNYPGTQIPVNTLTEQSCAVGNPCSVGSGLKTQTETDFISTGPSPLALKRTYRSSTLVMPIDGFGSVWMHEWQRRLDLSHYNNATPSLAALRGDGTTTTFTLSGGVWSAKDGKGDQIVPVSNAGGIGQGFRLIDRRTDSTEDYDADGKLLLVKARNGWTTSLKYSTASTPKTVAPYANLLIEIRSQFGQIIRFAYDAYGRISAATMPDATIVQYGYNNYGMLSTVTYADGAQRKYHYENPEYKFRWALTGITDEKGVRFATYGYDSLGRATSTEHAGGVDKFQLNFLGNGQTSVTTTDGTSRTFTTELQGNVLRATGASAACPACGDIAKAVTYDTAGNVASKRDFADKEARYSYDVLGREMQRIEGYGTADAKTTTTEWHPTWNLPLKIASPGRMDVFTYDVKGQTTSYVTHATNDLTGTLGLGAVPVGQSTGMRWEYDISGLAVAAIDTVNNVENARWTYTYDTAGNLATLTNPQGQIGRALSYDSVGRLLTAIDTSGRQIEIQYNSRGAMTRYQRGTDVVVYGYNQVGFLTTVSGPGAFRYELEYDDAHRLVAYWLPSDMTTGSLTSLSENPFGLATASTESAPASNAKASWLGSIWNTIKTWLGSLLADAHAQAGPTQLVRNPVNPWRGQSGPGMTPMPTPADVLEQGNGEKQHPDTWLTRLGAELGAAGIRMVRHIGGTVIGAARALSCDMNGGGEDDCERQRDQDEANCQSTVKARYGSAGAAICMRSAMNRYAECLRFGTAGIRTPLSGFETPL